MTMAMQPSPTSENEEAWIRAYSPDYIAPPLLSPEDEQDPAINRQGKWLVFVWSSAVDELWHLVASATCTGILGPQSKVSTRSGRGEDFRRMDDSFVICAYTADWSDVEDVRRVLRGIRGLGIAERLSYKRDAETYRGFYGPGSVYYRSPAGTDLVVPT